MKKLYFLTFFVIGVLIFGTSLASASVEVASGSIWAGQQYEVAWFSVYAEADQLKVRIWNKVEPWDIVLTHVGVYESPCDFPQTKKDPCGGGVWIPGITVLGNPKIGQFGYGAQSRACDFAEHEIPIPYTAIIDGDVIPGNTYRLYISIHTEVRFCDEFGIPVEGIDETGWGGPCSSRWFPGNPFPPCSSSFCFFNFGKKQWSGYFIEFDVTVPVPTS